jgi:hypothetical protein
MHSTTYKAAEMFKDTTSLMVITIAALLAMAYCVHRIERYFRRRAEESHGDYAASRMLAEHGHPDWTGRFAAYRPEEEKLFDPNDFPTTELPVVAPVTPKPKRHLSVVSGHLVGSLR